MNDHFQPVSDPHVPTQQKDGHPIGQPFDGAFKGALSTFATSAAATGGKLPPIAVLVIGLSSLVATAVAVAGNTLLEIRSAPEAQSLGTPKVAARIIASAERFASNSLGPIILCGLFPLFGYLLAGGLAASAIVAGCLFFSIGAIKHQRSTLDRCRSGLNALLLGTSTGALAYAAGYTIQQLIEALGF